MKVYTYSQARRDLAELLVQSKGEEVLIHRRGGDCFAIVPRRRDGSPFDVPSVKGLAATSDILEVVRESRSKTSLQRRSRRRGQGVP